VLLSCDILKAGGQRMGRIRYRFTFFLLIFVYGFYAFFLPDAKAANETAAGNWLYKKEYTFIWLSDTQYYAENYPHVLEKQVNWIVSEKDKLNIQYVIHTGDLINKANKRIQWERADRLMGVLDNQLIPYGVLAGNHDLVKGKNGYSEFTKYFDDTRFKENPWYGETYQNNKGHYDVISAEGDDYIIVYLGWGINQPDIDWINDVLKQNSDRRAILAFHDYLYTDGERSPIGQKLFEQVVKKNKNVELVLSGHYHGASVKADDIDDDGDEKTDRTVYQVLADYQGAPEGGQGFLRVLTINPKQETIHFTTFSPYLNSFNYFDADKFPGKDDFIIKLREHKKNWFFRKLQFYRS
jgi:predicted MPP superfamily phosphohydrolase